MLISGGPAAARTRIIKRTGSSARVTAAGFGSGSRSAAAVAQRISDDPAIEHAEASGPGFVNITLSDSFLGSCLMEHFARDDSHQTSLNPRSGSWSTIRLPTWPKRCMSGHLRSTIIGDALVRMFEFEGADVLPQNHIGDWGTPFGMLIEHLTDTRHVGSRRLRSAATTRWETSTGRPEPNSTTTPASVSGLGTELCCCRKATLDSTAVWEALRGASCAHFGDVYRDLGVLLDDDDIRGESAYQPTLEHDRRRAAIQGADHRDSDGALCAFPAGFKTRDGSPLPLMVRKADGGYGYAATDLAAIRYRTQELDAEPSRLRCRVAPVDAPGDGVRGGPSRGMARRCGDLPRSVRVGARTRRQDAEITRR